MHGDTAVVACVLFVMFLFSNFALMALLMITAPRAALVVRTTLVWFWIPCTALWICVCVH